MKSKELILLRNLLQQYKKTISQNIKYIVKYENDDIEVLDWGEMLCYMIMLKDERYKPELLGIKKIFCSEQSEKSLNKLISVFYKPDPQCSLVNLLVNRTADADKEKEKAETPPKVEVLYSI